MRRRARAVLAVSIITLIFPTVACMAQAERGGAPDGALDPEVDRILTRLEEREVRDLHASMTWSQQFAIEEGGDKKLGELWFKRFEPVPKFLASFDRKVDRAEKKIDEVHFFDGVWYEERKGSGGVGSVVRRQVRRQDDPANPFEVGVGPFPLPFGQKKSRILGVFEVERVGAAPDDPVGTMRLRLTPRQGTREWSAYASVEFWIAMEGRNAGLPIKVRAAKKDGTGAVNVYVTVEFDRIELNAGLSDSVFKVEVPPGYQRLPDEPLADDARPSSGASEQPAGGK